LSIRQLDSFLLGKASHYDLTNVAFQDGNIYFYAGDGKSEEEARDRLKGSIITHPATYSPTFHPTGGGA